MGPPTGVPGGYGEGVYETDTVVEQRGWFSGARLTALITAIVLVIAGAAVAIVLSGDESAQLEDVVPAGALAFGKANLIAPGGQADAFRSLMERFPLPEGQEPGDAFERLLNDALAEQDLTFDRDVRPWLGSQVGFVVTEVAFGGERPAARWALLASVRDAGRARATLDKVKASEPGMAYDIRESTAFIAPELISLESVLRAVDGDTKPLSEDEGFTSTSARVPDEYLGLLYIDGDKLQDALPPGSVPFVPGVPSTASGKQVIVLRAEPDAMTLEGYGTEAGPTPGGVPALLEAGPQELTAAITMFDPAAVIEQGMELVGAFVLGFQAGFGGGGFETTSSVLGQQVPEVKEMLDAFMRQSFGLSLDDDVFPWLHGEMSLLVGRLTLAQPEAGVLIESTDDAAAGRTIDALRERLGALVRDAGVEVTPAPGGFALTFTDAPVTLVVRRVAGKVVIASSDAYADQLLTSSSPALADDTVYRRSVGDPGADDVVFQLFVRIDRIASFMRAFVPPAEYEQAEPYLDPLEALGMRVTSGDDGSTFRMVLTVR